MRLLLTKLARGFKQAWWILFLICLCLELVNLFLSFIPITPDSWLLEVNSSLGGFFLIVNLITLAGWRKLGIPSRLSNRQARVLLVVVVVLCMSLAALPLRSARASMIRLESAPVSTLSFALRQLNRFDESGSLPQTDLLALICAPQAKCEQLNSNEYRERLLVPSATGAALMLFSKHSFVGVPKAALGVGIDTLLYARVALADQSPTQSQDAQSAREVDVVVFNLIDPWEPEAMVNNRILLRRVSTLARHNVNPVIAAGNFKGTLFSKSLQRFAWGARLKVISDVWSPEAWFTTKHVLARSGELNIVVSDYQ